MTGLIDDLRGAISTWSDDEDPDTGTTNRLLQRLVEMHGGASAQSGELISTDAYIAAPNGGVLGVPEGTTSFNFGTGTVQHSKYSDDLDTMKSINDLGGVDTLRAATIWVDVPADVRLGSSERIQVPAGVHRFDSSSFSSVSVETNEPARVAVVASTRSDAPVNDVGDRLVRVAEFGAGTYNDMTRVAWTTPEMVARENSYADHAETGVSLTGADATVIVSNSSGNGNELSAELRGRADSSEEWRTIASTSSAIPDGDHYVFNVDGPLSAVDLRVKNAMNGQTVAAEAQLYGGE